MKNGLLNTKWHLLKTAVCLLLLSILLPRPIFAAGPPPSIISQPQDATVLLGNTATFSVAASSGTLLSYQWYKVGLLGLDSLLSGETRTNLVISNVGLLDGGQFYVKVSNAGGPVQSRSATLTVGLLSANSVPATTNDTYSISEDNILSIPAPGVLANDSDANSDPMTATVVTNVSQGTLAFSANGAFSYTPPTNFFGSVSFSYRAFDGNHSVLEQNTSGGDNRQITAGASSAQSFKHGAAGDSSYFISKVVLYLSRRSGGTGNLNVSIGTGLNSGDIAGSAKAIAASSITNTSDGASFQAYTVLFDSPIGPFTAGTTYYLNLANQATERFYAEYPNNNTYANGTYYEGGVNSAKDIRFQIYEVVPSTPATVTINVLPVNDAPIAVDDSATTPEDTSVTINVLANDSDVEGSPLTVTGVSPTSGTFVINSPNITYTPPTNFYGAVNFDYYVSDGVLVSTGHVTVTVTSVNDAPVANNDNYTTAQGTVLNVPGAGQTQTFIAPTSGIGVLTNDTDVEGDTLTALLVSTVSHGTLTLNANGSFTYTPAPDFSGADSFTYRASDGSDASGIATVTINVTPVASPAQMSSQKMTPSGFQFQITGTSAATYVISVTTNFRDWTPIATNYAASGSMTFTDTDSVNNRIRFYRVETR